MLSYDKNTASGTYIVLETGQAQRALQVEAGRSEHDKPAPG
jgi:hypothetical protein